jgi:prolyl oligopeptidase
VISSRLNLLLVFAALWTTALANATPTPVEAPATPLRPVTETYQGVKVTDPYRWLENSTDSEVQKWTEAQAQYAKDFLEHLPNRGKIKAKLQKWNDFKSSSYRALSFDGDRYFALKLQPPKNQAILVTLNSLADTKTEHVILDPNILDKTGTTAIDFFVPSIDGKQVAVSLSKGGSEEGTVHIYKVADGKELAEQIPLVNKPTGGGSVAWNKDGSGFFYTRYPHASERAKEDMDFYQQIYFHKLGDDPENDSYSLGKDFPRIAEIFLQTSRNGRFTFATVANGDGGEFAHYVLSPSGKWTQITQFSDKATHAALGMHDDLYLVSLAGSPRGRILHLSLEKPDIKKATVFAAENENVISEILPMENQVYVNCLVGGPTEIYIFDLAGQHQGTLAVSSPSDNGGMGRGQGEQIVFKSQSYTQPAAWYEFSPAGKGTAAGEHKPTPSKTALVNKSPVSFSDIEVNRQFAQSKDGTKVPMTILSKKGVKLDGKNPTLLYGYGGYSISLTPRFMTDVHLWLEHGGVYVVANLRGGGEFGESWHREGNLTKKQNVFDDFIACAQYLVDNHYTNPNKLAIEGGSNGGLLMGAALTQRPELFHAVVSHVGIYDMLRVETDPNGAFNVTEFGTVKDPAQFKALYDYSPLHHVKDGVAYPATLLLTGANDGRVNPYHSKKMAARLQAVSAGLKSAGQPALLRVTFDGGHGIGKSVTQKVNEEADVYAFLFSQLGMKY